MSPSSTQVRGQREVQRSRTQNESDMCHRRQVVGSGLCNEWPVEAWLSLNSACALPPTSDVGISEKSVHSSVDIGRHAINCTPEVVYIDPKTVYKGLFSLLVSVSFVLVPRRISPHSRESMDGSSSPWFCRTQLGSMSLALSMGPERRNS